jgi:DNA-binding beta-propeller fold protein YncE
MFELGYNPMHGRAGRLLAIALLVAIAILPAYAKKKKQEAAPPPVDTSSPAYILAHLDYSRIVWPNPPAITRIKFLNWFDGQKPEPQAAAKKKSSWMDRLAGVQSENDKRITKPRYMLWTPYGLAVDSKGQLYVADARVGAIFIFNPETKDVSLIANGASAKFGAIIGLAIDDDDRLFVSDSQLNRILVFSPQHRVIAAITEGLQDPAGLAIDSENRFLYVADTGLDQVLVYDADSYKLLRRIGTTGKNHTLTTPGDFSKPTNVAVDKDGNLYVSDTLNDRIEIFDADGNFISTFGKPGDGPGYFARPKGIAVDCDGHIWVADAVQDRVQVFDKEGRLLIWMGGNGLLPGQFSALTGLTIDKFNRVFTSEQFPGRVQEFRYITQAEALAEKKRRDAEAAAKKLEGAAPPAGETAAPKPASPLPPAQKDGTAAKPSGSAAN